MTLDNHTECPACPIILRNWFAASQVLIALLDRYGSRLPADLREALENERIAVEHWKPLVEAHLENQEHAMSPHLVHARQLTTSSVTVVEARVLPLFGKAHGE